MPWTVYGILVVLGLFVLLMILNPKISCFGRKIRSPLYPLLRKKKQRSIKTEDYGFHLVDEEQSQGDASTKSEDMRLKPGKTDTKRKKKALKTHDYGFNLSNKGKKKGGEGS
ncbi:MAG: hypothetical protein PVF22_00260 [Candidatus Aminicenantes bacterium]